ASTGRHDTKSRLALRSAVGRVLGKLGFVDKYTAYRSDYHYTSTRRDPLANAPDETLLKLTLWAYLVDADDRKSW
ncbi:hypothetical protein, partial [Limosilactobacillus reuteri]|uniref:hypothetical protein n=1 Tax=Limosilactobacillus reuteri TaxID=1598 RepID=UPI00207D0FB9